MLNSSLPINILSTHFLPFFTSTNVNASFLRQHIKTKLIYHWAWLSFCLFYWMKLYVLTVQVQDNDNRICGLSVWLFGWQLTDYIESLTLLCIDTQLWILLEKKTHNSRTCTKPMNDILSLQLHCYRLGLKQKLIFFILKLIFMNHKIC